MDCISGGGVGECGNGVCEPGIGEDCLSCAADCAGKQVGATKRQYCCGDGDGNESVGCDDPRCTSEGFACGDTTPPYCCGDGDCEGIEDYQNCAIDSCQAPYCGDGVCDPDEICDCSLDCGTPPSVETNCTDSIDDDCDGYTDLEDSDCSCLVRSEPCTENAECCSGQCHPVKGECK